MLTELSALLDLLRAKGVTHARLEPMSLPAPWGVIDVTFAPAVAPALAIGDETPNEPEPVSDNCRCGHAFTEHAADGLCLHACDAERCATPEGA